MPQWPPCHCNFIPRSSACGSNCGFSLFYHIVSYRVMSCSRAVWNDLQHIVWEMVSCIWLRLNLFPAFSYTHTHIHRVNWFIPIGICCTCKINFALQLFSLSFGRCSSVFCLPFWNPSRLYRIKLIKLASIFLPRDWRVIISNHVIAHIWGDFFWTAVVGAAFSPQHNNSTTPPAVHIKCDHVMHFPFCGLWNKSKFLQYIRISTVLNVNGMPSVWTCPLQCSTITILSMRSIRDLEYKIWAKLHLPDCAFWIFFKLIMLFHIFFFKYFINIQIESTVSTFSCSTFTYTTPDTYTRVAHTQVDSNFHICLNNEAIKKRISLNDSIVVFSLSDFQFVAVFAVIRQDLLCHSQSNFQHSNLFPPNFIFSHNFLLLWSTR